MIATELFQNLDGNISIPTSQIIFLKNGKLITGAGDIITLTGTGGTTNPGGGGTDPGDGGTTTPPTEVQDLTLQYTPIAIDSAVDNIVRIDQDTGQANFSKYQFTITQNEFTLSAGTSSSMAVSRIKMKINSVGYQIVKILMYDEADQLITFSRTDADTVQRTTNSSVKIDINAAGFTLITNASYELANIFNTDKMPVASTAGWYSVTSNTDINANFEAILSSTINVSRVVIYRQGASSTTFNGGTNDYTITFIDAANVEKVINVPKVTDSEFVTIANPTTSTLGSSGKLPDPSTKVYNFTLGTSLDGITFEDISGEGTTTYTQNPTTQGYIATTVYPLKTVNTNKLFFKIPDKDITSLAGVKIDMWRAS